MSLTHIDSLDHVERRRFDPVPEQKFLRPGKFLHRGDEPQREPIRLFQGHSGLFGMISYHWILSPD